MLQSISLRHTIVRNARFHLIPTFQKPCHRHITTVTTNQSNQSTNPQNSATDQSQIQSTSQTSYRYSGTSVLSRGAGSYAGLGTGSYADQPDWTPIPRLTHSSEQSSTQSTTGAFSLLEDDLIVSLSSGWLSNTAVTKYGAAFQWGQSTNPSIKQTVLISRLRSKVPGILRTLQSFELGRLTFTNGLTQPTLIDGFGLTQAELINQSRNQSNNQSASQSQSQSKHAVSCVNGGDFNALLTMNGDIYTWGGNFYGQLGHSPNKPTINKPTKIMSLSSNSLKIKQMSAGFNHFAMVTTNGELLVAGKHQHGALGLMLPKTPSEQKDSKFKGVLHPRLVLETAAADSTTPLSLDEKSALFKQSVSKMRLPVQYIGPVVKVACGMKHTVLINQSGQAYSCGTSDMAEIGGFESRDLFGLIEGLEGQFIIDIAVGTHHSLFLTSEGRVFACGLNQQGQCGIPHEESIQSPKRTTHRNQGSFLCVDKPRELELPADFRAVAIFAGFYDSALVDGNGRCLWMGGGMEQKGYSKPHFDEQLERQGAVRGVAFGLAHALAVVDAKRSPLELHLFNQSNNQSNNKPSGSINQSIRTSSTSSTNIESESSHNSDLPHSTSTGRPSWY